MLNADAIAEKYYPRILGEVCRAVPANDADDVTQEVFVGVISSIDSFRGGSTVWTWLYRIMQYKVADYYRQQAWESKILAESGILVAEETEPVGRTFVISELIYQLPLRYKQVIWQRYILDMTYGEIGNKTDSTYEAARSRCRRALKYIRDNDLMDES